MEATDPNEDPSSDYDESVGTAEFTSITASRLRYSFQHGRRYQGFLQDRYGFPNDDTEQMREGFKHKLYVDYILGGRLICAPVGHHPQKIVDLGTGVGYWAQDVADHYPSARVIGSDISPIQPHWTPPNVEFHVEDLEDEHRPWTNIYEDADLIHIRAFLQTVRNPRRIIERSFENLKPGGWIESHEAIPEVSSSDGTAGHDHPLNKLCRLLDGPFARIYGWDMQTSRRIPELLKDAGFININVRHNRVPLGRWHPEARMREMGMFCQIVCEGAVAALLGRPDTMGLSEEEAACLTEEFYVSVNDPSIHAHMDWVDVWAQKPDSRDA